MNQTKPPKEVKGYRRKYCIRVSQLRFFSDIFAPLTSTAVSFTLHQVERHLFSIAQKQNSTPEFYCQLTELADFDYLLDKSRTETDSDDTRADDLTRRRSNKRAKTKSIQKAAERARGRMPKRLSGRLRDRSALVFSFSFVCGAGVCLSRRAQRADLYKTSTRQGAKDLKTDTKFADNIDYFANLCYNIIKKIQKLS